MNKTLLGIFSDRIKAENVVAELEAQGYSPKDISIIIRDHPSRESAIYEEESNIAEGAASGVATGGLVGGLAGLLIGIGAIAIPGIGALLIAGPLATALGLTGVAAMTMSGAVSGAVAGGLVGGLIGLGLPEEEAKVIEGRIKEGGILVSLPVLIKQEPQVRNIFHLYHVDMIRAIPDIPREAEIQAQSYQDLEPSTPLVDQDAPDEVRYPPPQESVPEPKPIYPPDPSVNYQRSDQVYYSDIRPEPKAPKPTFWQKLKNLFS